MRLLQGKIKLKFGPPKHGWLWMNLKCEDYDLNLAVSNVPNDPLDDLRAALMNLTEPTYRAWGPQEIIFHLEPDCYYFRVSRNNNQLNIVISESKEFDGKRYPLIEIEGDYQGVIMPFYRALMDFYSYDHTEPNWRKKDNRLIDKLKRRIKVKLPITE